MTSNQTNSPPVEPHGAEPHGAESLAQQSADESDLVRGAQRGDRGAIEELAARVRPRLVHLLRVKTRCSDDAEDIAQLALMRAIERIDQHDGRRSFSAWLYRIALRLVADHHRKARPKPGLDASDLQDRPGSDPEKAATDNELRDNLWPIAGRVLSDEQYTALWLRYGEDLAVGDVASALGRTRISTRVLLHRARARLAPHVLGLTEPDEVDANEDLSPASTPTPVTCSRGDV